MNCLKSQKAMSPTATLARAERRRARDEAHRRLVEPILADRVDCAGGCGMELPRVVAERFDPCCRACRRDFVQPDLHQPFRARVRIRREPTLPPPGWENVVRALEDLQ